MSRESGSSTSPKFEPYSFYLTFQGLQSHLNVESLSKTFETLKEKTDLNLIRPLKEGLRFLTDLFEDDKKTEEEIHVNDDSQEYPAGIFQCGQIWLHFGYILLKFGLVGVSFIQKFLSSKFYPQKRVGLVLSKKSYKKRVIKKESSKKSYRQISHENKIIR